LHRQYRAILFFYILIPRKWRPGLFEMYLEQNSFHIVETKHVFGLIDSGNWNCYINKSIWSFSSLHANKRSMMNNLVIPKKSMSEFS